MRLKHVSLGIVACIVAGSAAGFAAQKIHADWPSAQQVKRAFANHKYKMDHIAKEKYKGHPIIFTPCEMSDLSGEQKARGMILGKLQTEVSSADKLPKGTYLVYVQKRNDQWQAFFCEPGTFEPIQKSTEVKSDLDDHDRPSFEVDNTTIRYWRLRVAY